MLRRSFIYLILLCLIILLTTSACTPKAITPLPVLEYGLGGPEGATDLLIFLRGIGGSHRDFEKQGLIDAVRSRNLPLDIVVPDAHYGYYENESLVVRLKQDIIDPARNKGYRRIWLAGFSMGGLGSLFYIREHPQDVCGVMLVSPFVGWGTIRKEIQQAGNVADWDPSTSAVNDWQNLIWSFIREYAAAPGNYPPVYLGYGTKDGVTKNGPRLLGNLLPTDRVFTVDGRHTYKTFRDLWEKHLDHLEVHLRSPVIQPCTTAVAPENSR